jgi:four helix bundle protein
VWQDAMTLAESCYRLTRQFPREELFGLTSQIRRASGSVPANIAEGHGRENTGNFVQHLRISQGSLKELETHLILAERVGILLAQCESLGKMVRALIRALQDKSTK